MAEEEIASAAAEAESRWPLLGAMVIHRYGRIALGERIVLVAVAAKHRGAAFAAAEMLMDYLKTPRAFLEAGDTQRRRCRGIIEGRKRTIGRRRGGPAN